MVKVLLIVKNNIWYIFCLLPVVMNIILLFGLCWIAVFQFGSSHTTSLYFVIIKKDKITQSYLKVKTKVVAAVIDVYRLDI